MMEEDKSLVSVIVPAYNAEAVLGKCVYSIIRQSYSSLEVIIVDDGSTDSTPVIAENMALEDSRIKVLHKNNGGVSSARNYALRYVSGEWITFVDSDDFLDTDFLQSLLYGIKADLIVGGFNVVGSSELTGVVYPSIVAKDKKYISSLLEDHLVDMTFLCPWGKLFRTSIIRKLNLLFNTDMRIGEDVVFVWNYLVNCKDIALRSSHMYNYYTEPSDFKYALDEKMFIFTVMRIFEPLMMLERKWNINVEKAKKHILNYYIWLYKLYVKRFYKLSDLGRVSSFFNQNLVYSYFEHYKSESKDKYLVYMLLKLRLPGLIYFLIKLYY